MQASPETWFRSLNGKIPWNRQWQPFLAWKILWTEEPGRLQSMGSQRVRHDWACVHACTQAHTHTHTEPINNVVIVSGEQQRDPAICIHVSILLQIPFPSTLPCNIPGLYSRSSLVIHFKYSSVYMSIPNSLTILSSHPSLLATISSFSKFMRLRNKF